MSDTLLQYALATSPDPVQAAAQAAVTLVGSNDGTRLVDVTQIVVRVAPGTDAKDLTAAPASIVVEPPAGWSSTSAGGSITLTPPGGGVEVGTDGLVVVLAAITVNDQPGTTTITLDETASATGHESATRSTKLPLAKFPIDFAVSPLAADPLEVESGGSTALTWTGTPASYTLTYDVGSGVTSVPVGDTGSSYPVAGLTRYPTVVFTLVVSVTVVGQDEALVVQRQASVSVSEPAPVVTSFTAEVEAQQVLFTWRSQNADGCSMNAVPQALNANDEIGPLMPDRVHYTLVAHASETGAVSAPALQDLELTAVASQRLEPLSSNGVGWSLPLLSPDGSHLYVQVSQNPVVYNQNDPYVCAVDTTSLATVASVPGGASSGGGVTCFALSPDGTRLLLGTQDQALDNYLVLLSTPGLEQVASIPCPGPLPVSATYSADGATIYASSPGDSSSSVLVLGSDLTQKRSFAMPGFGPCAVSPDGSRVYVAAGWGTLFVCDAGTGAIVGQTGIGANAGGIALDPIRKRAYTTGSGSGYQTVSIVDTALIETLASPGVGHGPGAIVLGPGGHEVYTANWDDRTLSVVDTTTLETTGTIALSDPPVGLACAADGLKLYVVVFSGDVCRLEVTGVA